MPDENFLEKKEENIAIHIFSVSATMVGVCLTVLSLLAIRKSLNKIESLAEELVAVDSFLFLTACLVSYVAMRIKERKRRYRLEKVADIFFLVAISCIVLTSVLLVLDFI